MLTQKNQPVQTPNNSGPSDPRLELVVLAFTATMLRESSDDWVDLGKCMGLNIQRDTQIQNIDAPWQEEELRAYYTSCGKDGRVSFFSKFIISQESELVVSFLLPIMQISPVSQVPPCPLFQALPYQSPLLPLISPISPSLLDLYGQYITCFCLFY